MKILVSDTGAGIAKEDQHKLFGKFHQVGKDSGKQGTGLGLYLSRELAKKMGGDVWLEDSAPEKGSTFGLSLPLAESKPG